MQKLSRSILIAGFIVASVALTTYGGITGSELTTTISYGYALSVQTINTGFGNSPGGGDATMGSELDAGYGTIAGGNLYLFLTGDFENNGNHLNVFIGSSDVPGQNVLNIGSSNEANMNGSTFSPGFSPNYMIDANDYAGTEYVDGFSLPNGSQATQAYLGDVPGSGGVYPATSLGPFTLALNNTHASTMGTAGATLSGATSGTQTTTGMELQIPLNMIGNPAGAVMVMADINGGGDSYLSNQFLPGLPVGSGNVGSPGSFNFSSTPGEYFTVVPEPSSISLVVVGLLGAITMVRRRKA